MSPFSALKESFMQRDARFPQVENVRLSENGDSVIIIDQTQLPGAVKYLELRTDVDFYDAILKLKVRGAPAIGICAAFGYYIMARRIAEADPVCGYEEFCHRLQDRKEYLNSSRPTAVNLSWALNRMEETLRNHEEASLQEILEILEEEAIAIQQEDIEMCRKISGYGLSLLKDGDGILTHCNAGPLATSVYGTGLGPLMLGREQGMNFHVYSDETRPLLQGARLTSYELQKAGIDVTLICDNMASLVMKNGWIQACLVGCDRVAMNGDVANKIGTSGVAILAKYYGIPFYVLGPVSTIDRTCSTGADIPIELRKPEEIKEMFYEKPMALSEVKCYNPAFDVTDHELITAIITDRGICRPPYTQSLAALFEVETPNRSVE